MIINSIFECKKTFAEVSKHLFLLENDLYLGFDVKICRIKDDFSYTDWEIRVLPDSNKTEHNKGGRPIKDVTEKKKYRITVKLTTEDYYTLTVEQADFIRKLCGMANNLNQLAHRANAEGFHAIAPFHKIIIGKIDEVLNLIRR